MRALGENIPPLFNSYMNLSPTMKTFGTSLNPEFGDVEETGILVTLSDIYESKKRDTLIPISPESELNLAASAEKCSCGILQPERYRTKLKRIGVGKFHCS